MALALALTIAIETIVAFALGYRTLRDMKIMSLANAITNPALNFVLLAIAASRGARVPETVVIALEIVVVIVEWHLFTMTMRRGRGELFRLSLAANLVSYLSSFVFFG